MYGKLAAWSRWGFFLAVASIALIGTLEKVL